MAIKEDQITIRGNNHQKFYATTFGIKNTYRTVILEVGNERTFLPNGQEANVADCSITMDFIAFKTLYGLLGHQLKKIEDEFGEIDLEEEERQSRIQAEKVKKERERMLKTLEHVSEDRK